MLEMDLLFTSATEVVRYHGAVTLRKTTHNFLMLLMRFVALSRADVPGDWPSVHVHHAGF